MGKITQGIKRTVPWIDPVIEYFDWKKYVLALVAAIAMAVWSFVKDNSWPLIVTIAFSMLVQMMYLLYLPAYLSITQSGIKTKPNHSIWKYKSQFALYQAACLLANSEPTDCSKMDGDSRAWYFILCDAIKLKEITHIPSRYDDVRRTGKDGYIPYENTVITVESLKAFCVARKRKPEFLIWSDMLTGSARPREGQTFVIPLKPAHGNRSEHAQLPQWRFFHPVVFRLGPS